jgi:hypothetical protein
LLHLLLEHNVGAELRALLDEVGGQVPGQHAGQAADVVDVLLGVQRHQLAAEFRQRIDNAA